MVADPRNRTQRDMFRRQVLAIHGPTCHLCGRAIDLRLKAPHRGSYTADHVPELVTLLEQGLDPFNPAYGRPAHWSCNSSSGASFGNKRRRGPTRTSRTW